MSENKTTKYFKYAIGEIILVVIGILIALQINNWNENRKDREQEIVLLKSLSVDLELDILQLKSNSKSSKERIERIKKTLNLLKEPKQFKINDFGPKAKDLVFDNYFICNSGAFDEAVSSGKMSLVKSQSLNKEIFNYYRTAKANVMDGTAKQSTDEFIAPIFIELIALNVDAFKMFGIDLNGMAKLNRFDIQLLKENKEFWKMVMIKLGNTAEQIRSWKRKQERAVKLKKELEQEIELLVND